MKKLILPEGFEKDPTYKKPAAKPAASSKSTSATAPAAMKKITSTNLTQFKALDPAKTQAELDAFKVQAAITPDTGILDPRNNAAFVAPIKNPWMLVLLYGSPAALGGGGVWLLIRAIKRRKLKKLQKLNLQSTADVVNNPEKIKRLEKALMKQNYQNYLIDNLYKDEWLTEAEYKAIKRDIELNKFKFKFLSPDKIRKEFKTFVIACMKHDRISIKDFRRYSELSPAEIKQFMQAKLKFKIASKIPLSQQEKDILNPPAATVTTTRTKQKRQTIPKPKSRLRF